MVFEDRSDAGKKLAVQLKNYKNAPDTLVVGLPRGGVVTAFEVARDLGLPLDIVVPRKIGTPGQPELAAGAISQEGTFFANHEVMRILGLTSVDLHDTIEAEKKEAQRRVSLYRGDRAPLDCHGKVVIIIDDGIATGMTMQAAISTVKSKGAEKIVIAVPVAPPDVVEQLGKEVNEVVCLQTPLFFEGIGLFYRSFTQTTDQEVINLLQWY